MKRLKWTSSCKKKKPKKTKPNTHDAAAFVSLPFFPHYPFRSIFRHDVSLPGTVPLYFQSTAQKRARKCYLCGGNRSVLLTCQVSWLCPEDLSCGQTSREPVTLAFAIAKAVKWWRSGVTGKWVRVVISSELLPWRKLPLLPERFVCVTNSRITR